MNTHWQMFQAIQQQLTRLENEVSKGVERLRMNVSPSLHLAYSGQVVNDFLNTQAGSDLMLKFQLSLEQLAAQGEENVRLANKCSTRMGSAQQKCQERADALLSVDSFLRNTSAMERRIRELNRQLDKLSRFCEQTELAMTHLEALHYVVETEKKVHVLRRESSALKQPSLDESSATPPTIQRPLLVEERSPSKDAVDALVAPALRASDAVREKHEEVLLEEFLSKP